MIYRSRHKKKYAALLLCRGLFSTPVVLRIHKKDLAIDLWHCKIPFLRNSFRRSFSQNSKSEKVTYLQISFFVFLLLFSPFIFLAKNTFLQYTGNFLTTNKLLKVKEICEKAKAIKRRKSQEKVEEEKWVYLENCFLKKSFSVSES